MYTWQKILTALVIGLMVYAAVAYRGSIGSAVCIYGLIMMGAGFAYQKYLTNRSSDDFTEGE